MKLSKNKKGMELQSALVVLIIFGVVLLMLIFFYKNFLQGSSKEMDVAKCQSSLLLTKAVSDKAKGIACSVGSLTPFTIDCPRQFVSVNNGEVNKNGKSATSKYDAKCPTGESTCLQQNVVASEMAFCSNLFFNGEQVVLQQMEMSEWSLLTPKDHMTTCFICSEITVDKDTGDLLSFLKAKTQKSGKTYYDSLANNKKAWCNNYYEKQSTTCWDGMRTAVDTSTLGWAKNKPALDYTLKPGKYAVVFVREGLSSCDGETNDKKGDEYLTNTVQLIPADKISSYCNTVMS